MTEKRTFTPLYIILLFMSPLFLAWIMSQTKFATQPSATTNQGMLIDQTTTWLLDDLKTPKTKMWKVLAITSDPEQCSKLVKHADASIVLLKDQAKRVHLLTSDICQHYQTQTPSSTIEQTQIIQHLKQYFPQAPQSPYYEIIVDPHNHVTMLYTHLQQEKALLKDMQVLLKYSKVG